MSFQLESGVALYGGFAGTETALEQRDPAANPTILSGDLNGDDGPNFANNGENSYHVVTGSGTDSSTILDGFTVKGGHANGSPPHGKGGGMYNVTGSPSLTNVTFSGNSASEGGGMYNYSGSPSLTNVTLSGNSATSSGGGGMSNSNSSNPSLTNVTLSGNSAVSGGGMGNFSSSPSLTNVTFSDNSVSNLGGGMFNYSGSPSLTNVTLSGNSANNYGGGMANFHLSSPSLTNVTLSGNSAFIGGGMYNSNSSPSLTNVTLSGNSGSSGGGMYNYDNSSLSLMNVTLSGNSGGGMFNVGSSPSLTNVIIANSTSGWDCLNDVSTLNAASANNLIEDPDHACGLTNGVNGNIIGADPKLGPLADNGGWTETQALQHGSPAINAGTNSGCPSTDQRGVARPEGNACEIGAYEVDIPIIASIKRLNPNPTSESSVDFIVTFSESVTGVDVADFNLVKTGSITGYSVTGVSGADATYTVTVNTGSGDGTLRLDLNASGTNIQDLVGHSLSGGYTGGQEYSVDKTPPVVSSIVRLDSYWTNKNSVRFFVTFSEAVTGVDAADFNLVKTGSITGYSVTEVSGAVATYTVTVNTGSGDGTLRLDLNASDTNIQDIAGNPISDGYTGGQEYSIDKTPPAVSSITRLNPNPTSKNSVRFKVTFSEVVNGVGKADFTLVKTGGITGYSITGVSGTGSIRTVTINTGKLNGTLRLDVKSSGTGIKDLVGNNLNGGFTTGQVYTVKKQVALRSQALYDGWVLESGEDTGVGGTKNNLGKVLLLGDNAQDKQYRVILSFGTAGIPDNAVITRVVLKVKKAGVVGTDPMNTHNDLVVDIKKGKFYTLPVLQIQDFQAKANKIKVGKFPKKLYSGWYRSVLYTVAYPFINVKGRTQLRLRFLLDDDNDNVADILKLYSGNAILANRPQLIVSYYVP